MRTDVYVRRLHYGLVLCTVLLEITRNCPCVVSRSQQNNSRSRFVSFPSLSVQNQSSQRGWSCASRVGGAASREAARNMVVRGER